MTAATGLLPVAGAHSNAQVAAAPFTTSVAIAIVAASPAVALTALVEMVALFHPFCRARLIVAAGGGQSPSPHTGAQGERGKACFLPRFYCSLFYAG
jgi:hypothetical protein